ncbi:ATP bind 4 domain containing protein [Trichuris trichiura]|uniref:Diphthine--ammonia ligase n=1 Tax=Trichuris trichiura TaxID=36087 RepID=A0A077Z3T5_TRITR|nr:ATP bind 4 domain containing protein [Trichuris trichiura]
MKVVGLISGGKDSCYNLCQCVEYGHTPVCIAQLVPPNGNRQLSLLPVLQCSVLGCDELDSYMFQTVGHEAVPFISSALCLPILRRTIAGNSVVCDMRYSPNEQDEVEDLFFLMKEAKEKYQVEAVAVGAICSKYQKERVANVCERLDLEMLAYLWQRDQAELLREMLNSGLRAILVKTSSLGLDPSLHLGKELNEMLPHFLTLNEKYGFNVCGEGGEYETLVTDCSIFRYKLLMTNAEVAVTNADSVCAVGHLKNLSFRLEKKG